MITRRRMLRFGAIASSAVVLAGAGITIGVASGGDGTPVIDQPMGPVFTGEFKKWTIADEIEVGAAYYFNPEKVDKLAVSYVYDPTQTDQKALDYLITNGMVGFTKGSDAQGKYEVVSPQTAIDNGWINPGAPIEDIKVRGLKVVASSDSLAGSEAAEKILSFKASEWKRPPDWKFEKMKEAE